MSRARVTSSGAGTPRRRHEIAQLALLLAAFALAAYGPALNLPFIGDDYIFLDKTRDASFAGIWSFENVDFQWYRPWSRELHFWSLQKVSGLNPIAYRAMGVILWLVALCLYAAIVRRLTSPRVALLATLGVASLAMWGTPLLWISGSQDLWMLSLMMASTLLFITGRRAWSVVPFGLALLSKETAAVLPALLLGYLILIEHHRLGEALRRTSHLWALAFGWLMVHPTLHERLVTGVHGSRELEHRPALLVILSKTVLSALNLDMLPRPQDVGWGDVLRVLASASILGVGTMIAMRSSAFLDVANGTRRALMGFALAWMVVGWFPLILPSIGWHAYYGCFGVLGAWLAVALWLQDRPKVVVAVITCLALLRGAQASTPSWNWGAEWYQRRAGAMLSAIREDLHRQHPTLPRHARVFFGHLPNNIGLVVGQSPALRVWYRDSTLQSGFYSYYRPRPEAAPRGQDFFFRFDSLRGMVEIKTGPEDVRRALRSNPTWESDHEKLAMLFLRSGDTRRAAAEFEKLSVLPNRPDALGYAAVCWETTGDQPRADSLVAVAGSRMNLAPAPFRDWVERLRESFPGR